MISSFVGRLSLFVGLGACITSSSQERKRTSPRFRISMVEKTATKAILRKQRADQMPGLKEKQKT
jgi:hypothetical protein